MKKVLALILSLLMVLALIPSVMADGEPAEATATLIDGLPETGDRVIIHNTKNKALDACGTNGYYNAGVDIVPADGVISGVSENILWDVTKNADGTYRFSQNGKYLSMGASYASTPYDEVNKDWAVAVHGNGYSIKNVAREVYLEWYATKNYFSGYANIDNSGAFDFLFYKFEGTTVKAPTASPDGAGIMQPGAQVTLSCEETGAEIFYRIGEEGEFAAYTDPITINESCTLYAYAIVDGWKSPTVSFVYTVNETGIMNLKQAVEAQDQGAVEDACVIGQLVFRYGNYTNLSTAILQAKVEGTVYALQVYNALEKDPKGDVTFQIGDWLILTGLLKPYNGTQQIQSVQAVRLATEEEMALFDTEDVSAPLVCEKFADVPTDMISRYVMVKNVTLGQYNSKETTNNEYTTMTDSANKTLKVYRAAPYPAGLQEGDVVNLYGAVSVYNNAKQLRNGSPRDYYPVNDTAAPVITRVNTAAAEVGNAYNFTVKVEDASGVANVKIEVLKNEEVLATITDSTVEGDIYAFRIPGDLITPGNLSVRVTATDARETPNTAVETFELEVEDLPQIISFAPLANSATGDNKRPEISVAFTNAGDNPTVVFTLNDEAVTPLISYSELTGVYTATYTSPEDMADGKVKVLATITRADGAYAEKTWSFTVGETQARLYFGMLHSHTAEYSDGAGTLEDAYEHAAAVDHIDFLAVTDHSNYFDDKNNLGDMTDATKGLKTADGSMTKWQEAKQTALNYTTSDFIAIYGYEMTWSGQYGHMNTFNSTGIESRQNPDYVIKGGDGLINYYNRLVEVANYDLDPEQGNRTSTVINQFNHPGTTFGTFEDFAHYSVAYDELITMIEVGNGEGKVRAGGYFPSYQYYTMALDKGWHLAPTNNQDNHKGGWGDSNTCRDVIYTDDFSEEGIYAAMHNRTMYATEDTDLEIYYTLNGEFMGAILDPVPEEGQKLNIRIDVNDPTDKIQKISLIANGDAVVASKTINMQTYSWEFEIDNNYSYYYVRVDEVDEDIAVTAPVWTNETLKVGMSPIEKNTVVEVKDEPITFTVPIYNYESAVGDAAATNLTVIGIEYRIGDTLVESIDNPTFSNGTNILSAEKKEDAFTWTYTPTEVGRFKLEVKVTGLYRETERVFTGSIDFTVRDGATMKTMLIDAGHSNFYVSGNYADSDAAFIELAARNGVRAQRITTPITDEVLENCDLLVLTVPYTGEKSNVGNDLTDYMYSDDELAAIHNYAQRGGNFIVTSKSDRREPAAEDQWASNISNRILEAIGAEARISKGIVSDAVNKTNESYRLHFTGKEFYNWNNPLTEYMIENTNLMFSCYNAAPVILNGAESIVNAFDTSFVSSYPLYYNNGTQVTADKIYQPYYDAAGDQDKISVLAYEKLPTGGFCITSGVTFFSTFEVKVDLDNWATRQNSNYQMVVNLFKMLNPVEVTPIADIQNQYQETGKLGASYTIEGYVTSNASGYDKDTAFFDCIYLQDDSGRGINVFPVAGNYEIGQKLRITGMTSEYQGEIELNCGNDYGGEIQDITLRDVEYTANGVTTTGYATLARLLEVEIVLKDKQTIQSYEIDDSALVAAVHDHSVNNRVKVVDATLLQRITTGQAAALEKLGNLVEIEGVVTDIGFDKGVLGTITVDDGTGAVVVYLDGYIKCDDDCEKDELGYHDLSFVEIGSYVCIRGISSSGQNSYEDTTAFGPRIRVRNRADVKPVMILYGDANADGKITSADAAIVLRALVGLSELSSVGAMLADVAPEFNGSPDAADAAMILRYVVGLIKEFDLELD